MPSDLILCSPPQFRVIQKPLLHRLARDNFGPTPGPVAQPISGASRGCVQVTSNPEVEQLRIPGKGPTSVWPTTPELAQSGSDPNVGVRQISVVGILGAGKTFLELELVERMLLGG